MTQENPFAGNQPVDEFELMRRRLRQRGGVRKEQGQRQLRRQAAALGNLPSGAFMKQQRLAATEADRLTGEQVQDVNIAEAQIKRQERESALDRGLQRFGIETQRDISREEIAGRQRIQDTVGVQQENLARISGANDIEIAKLRGADQKEIATMQIASQEKLAKLVEEGTDRRFAEQLVQNQKFFDIDSGLKQQGINLQEEIFANTKTQQEQQMKMDIFATTVNSIDLLKSFGMDADEIGMIVQNLNPDLGQKVLDAMTGAQTREDKTAIQVAEGRKKALETNLGDQGDGG